MRLLTMRLLTMRQREGELKTCDKSIEYEVLGLPPGHHAVIAFDDTGWQILHGNHGIPGEWVGTYESAEAALVALQQALADD